MFNILKDYFCHTQLGRNEDHRAKIFSCSRLFTFERFSFNAGNFLLKPLSGMVTATDLLSGGKQNSAQLPVMKYKGNPRFSSKWAML